MRRDPRALFAWLAVVAVFPALLIDVFNIDLAFLPDDLTMNMVLVGIGGIAASILSTDTQPLLDSVSLTQKKLNEVLLLSQGQIAAIRPSRNSDIWYGFKGTYVAMNPPLKLVHNSDDDYQSMVLSHAERFAQPDFKAAFYIFFTSGEPGRYFPNAYSDFLDFAKAIRSVAPEVTNKLRILVCHDKDAPGFTFFLGEKEVKTEKTASDVKYAIFYTNDRPFMSSAGFPNWSFISTDAEFNGTLSDFASEFIGSIHPMTLDEALSQRSETDN